MLWAKPKRAPPAPGSSGECFQQRLATCHVCELALTTHTGWIHHSSLTRCGERAELLNCNLLLFPSWRALRQEADVPLLPPAAALELPLLPSCREGRIWVPPGSILFAQHLASCGGKAEAPSVPRRRQERALGAQPMLNDGPSLPCLCSSSWGGLCSAPEGGLAVSAAQPGATMPRSGDLFGEEPLALKEGPQLLPFLS